METRKEEDMITIGVDAHKSVHASVALDDAGREIDRWRGPNSPAGWAQHLVAAGETVYDINPRWTAGERRRARVCEKSM